QKTGPDHDKTFWIEVHVGDRSFGAGKGKNKKEAEQEAARLAYESMTGEKSGQPDRGPRTGGPGPREQQPARSDHRQRR
ncbi:MAG TPA: putative dsRNA-binding protein, partial [Spirochaetia bacterium]|nr:putative dsRNA-binding protein [Spirochaetia bacterium]